MANEKKSLLKFWEPLCLIIFFLIIIFLVAGELSMEGNLFRAAGQCQNLTMNWLIIEDGKTERVNMSNLSKYSDQEQIIIYRKMPELERFDSRLFIEGQYQYIGVYIDETLRGEYRLDETGIKAGITPQASVNVPLYRSDADSRLSVVLKTDFSKNSKELVPTILLGTQESIKARNYLIYGIYLTITLLLMFFSITCLCGAIIFKIVRKRDIGLGYLSIFAACVSLWMAVRCNSRQLYMQNLTMAHVITYVILMLIPIPFVMFMNIVQNDRYAKFYRAVLCFPLINMAINGIACLIRPTDLSRYSWMTSIVGLVVIISVLYTFFKDVKTGYRNDIKNAIIALVIVVTSAIAEVIVYYSGLGLQVGSILGLALVCAGFLAVDYTVKREIREEKTQYKKYEENRAKSDFLSHVSHEMRTPMHAILGIDELLIESADNAKTKDYAMEIRKSGRELNELINDLLDHAAQESGEMALHIQRYSPRELFADVNSNMTSMLIAKGLELKEDISDSLPYWLEGDATKLRRVLISLLFLAITRTNSGNICLKAYMAEEPNEDMLFIRVIYTGRSISVLEFTTSNLAELQDEEAKYELINNEKEICWIMEILNLMDGSIAVEESNGGSRELVVRVKQKRVLSGNVVEKNVPEVPPVVIPAATEKVTRSSMTAELCQLLEQFDIHAEKALKVANNDRILYESLLRSFDRRSDELQGHLLDLLRKREFEEYASAVHVLKNNAESIGADEFAQAAMKQELLGDDKKADEIRDSIAQFFSDWNQIRYGITEYFRNVNN